MRRLVLDEKVDAVVGYTSSGNCLAIGPVAEELKVSFAFPTQTLHMVKPEDLEHPDRPADAASGLQAGRGVGREVAARGLEPFGGAKPPPVVID